MLAEQLGEGDVEDKFAQYRGAGVPVGRQEGTDLRIKANALLVQYPNSGDGRHHFADAGDGDFGFRGEVDEGLLRTIRGGAGFTVSLEFRVQPHEERVSD